MESLRLSEKCKIVFLLNQIYLKERMARQQIYQEPVYSRIVKHIGLRDMISLISIDHRSWSIRACVWKEWLAGVSMDTIYRSCDQICRGGGPTMLFKSLLARRDAIIKSSNRPYDPEYDSFYITIPAVAAQYGNIEILDLFQARSEYRFHWPPIAIMNIASKWNQTLAVQHLLTTDLAENHYLDYETEEAYLKMAIKHELWTIAAQFLQTNKWFNLSAQEIGALHKAGLYF